jgi:hypothetical protein
MNNKLVYGGGIVSLADVACEIIPQGLARSLFVSAETRFLSLSFPRTFELAHGARRIFA